MTDVKTKNALKTILVDSSSRLSGTPSDFIVSIPALKEVKIVTIQNVKRPKSAYNISMMHNNATYSWRVKKSGSDIPGTGSFLVTLLPENQVQIPRGFYTTKKLFTTLDKLLKPKGYTCFIDSDRRPNIKILDEKNGVSFGCQFGTGDLCDALGFYCSHDDLCGHSLGRFKSWLNDDAIYVSIDGLNTGVVNGSDVKYAFIIPESDNTDKTMTTTSIPVPSGFDCTQIQVKLWFANGQKVDTAGQEWKFELGIG